MKKRKTKTILSVSSKSPEKGFEVELYSDKQIKNWVKEDKLDKSTRLKIEKKFGIKKKHK